MEPFTVNTKTDSIWAAAEHLLRRDAEELRESSTSSRDRNDWTGEEEAKADYDEHIAAADALASLSTVAAQPPAGWREALEFYAQGRHFGLSDESAWDTVSGEPQNFWCDEAGTATIEDGSIAKLALSGHAIRFEDEDTIAPSEQAPAQAAPAAVALPEGWVPLVITHEGQYPEEIAYGPKRMMDRLDKWLRKYFDSVVAAKERSAPAADLQEDQTQPWYDLAWKHGARRHASFDGDELTELSFRPAQFDAFCAELAPAAGAVAPAAAGNAVVGCNECHITHDLGACTTAAPVAVAGQCEDAIELLGKYKELCEEIKRGDSYHLGRIDSAISVLAQTAPQPAVQQGGPVVWRSWDSENSRWNFTLWPDEWVGHADVWEPLYTNPAAPAAQGDALDAERYRLLRRGQRWSVIDGIGDTLRGDELDAAIDAARAAKEGDRNG